MCPSKFLRLRQMGSSCEVTLTDRKEPRKIAAMKGPPMWRAGGHPDAQSPAKRIPVPPEKYINRPLILLVDLR
jgi:hypothetical protein